MIDGNAKSIISTAWSTAGKVRYASPVDSSTGSTSSTAPPLKFPS